MKGKMTISRCVGFILAFIQLVLSVILCKKFSDMNFLPGKYLILLIGVLTVVFILVLLFQFFKIVHWIGKIISIVVIICIFLCFTYVNKTDSTLKRISEKLNVEKEQIIVVVNNDNKAESIDELKGTSIGIQYKNDKEIMGKAADNIKQKLDGDINLKAYDDYSELYKGLLGGEIDGMVLNSSYIDIIDELASEEKLDFSSNVHIIYTLVFEQKKKVDSNKVVKKDVDDESFLVYISGIDTYGDITTKSRSDVNILMAVNPNTRQIMLVTTPRDAYVCLPGVSGNSRDKLTHSGIYGVDCSIDTMNSIYDVDIDYYARVNFNSLINIVDALGGVDVNSRYEFSAGGYSFNKGSNHVDGAAALAFSRERHSFADGDYQRGRDQMEVIKGIVKKCTTPSILTGFDKIMDVVADQVQTSFPVDSIYTLVKKQLDTPGDWEVFSYETMTKGAREYCYSYSGKSLYVGYLIDSSVDKGKSLIDSVLSGKTITEADLGQ